MLADKVLLINAMELLRGCTPTLNKAQVTVMGIYLERLEAIKEAMGKIARPGEEIKIYMDQLDQGIDLIREVIKC